MADPEVDMTAGLLALDHQLLELLESLQPEDWLRPTVARRWNVKDVAAHLLDGNLRALSMLRDGYRTPFRETGSHEELVAYLNELNQDWVHAAGRLSPRILIFLHQVTGPLYCSYMASLPPLDKAAFAVTWAGQTQSTNRMHIAREYTEKFLHQQQIRDALGRKGLLNVEFYHPFLEICMLALPHTFREVRAAVGTNLSVTISGEGGGTWWLSNSPSGSWELCPPGTGVPEAAVEIPGTEAWKLFSKSIRAENIKDSIFIRGDRGLALTALDMVSFMA